MENSNSKNTYAIQNDKEVIYSRLNGNISLLHDPYSINHIHGLRKYLHISYFFNIIIQILIYFLF